MHHRMTSFSSSHNLRVGSLSSTHTRRIMFTTRFVSMTVAAALLFVGQASAGSNIPREASIAPDPVSACDNHFIGEVCNFFTGAPGNSPFVAGLCFEVGGTLTCVA
ncbi:hypothetical protein QCA50_008607 [Cerrena zonata]|uniref:Uncharacterized protein n=1 Tax=Cerrena zonata TaxID=2478898 RepID=A0AAW0G746_9APHY